MALAQLIKPDQWESFDDIGQVKKESLEGLGITSMDELIKFITEGLDPFNRLCRRYSWGKITVKHLYRIAGFDDPIPKVQTRVLQDADGNKFEVKWIKANLYTVINVKQLQYKREKSLQKG